jgi:wyosine [tRNA(Phe)-imidazoG37] synthetase (radical SAM superfamily)
MAETEKRQHRCTYGPVPSRRLGLSLGVDIVPMKVCTLDCIYCQLGRTTEKSTTRRDFMDLAAVLAEIGARVEHGLQADYITIGGSGEPTLNSRLGDLVDGIHRLTDIPVAILTNGTLLYRPDVRADCAKADLVVPSLDAGDEQVFEALNRPAADISIEKLVSGLSSFRDEFAGAIWLEVFIVPGVNSGPGQIAKIKELLGKIRPDRVQLNTAIRPPAEKSVEAADGETLAAIARQIGGNCELIAEAPVGCCDRRREKVEADVLSMLKRRPCAIQDLCTGLGMVANEVVKEVADLQSRGLIVAHKHGDVTYFFAPSKPS